jgi:FtsP/CotA-like multicopper oxidase with cupredoxin domain
VNVSVLNIGSRPTFFLLCLSTAFIATVKPGAQVPPRTSAALDGAIEPISINDNRSAAGTLDRGTLTIHLEARTGEWHPEGDGDPSLIVRAFAVEGGRLQVPGPLIRVVEGTVIRASIRNRLDEPLVLHGLYPRPANSARSEDPVVIPSGDVREIQFVAGSPGTYFYWGASSTNVDLARRPAADTQLSGAFIIDPRGTHARDRVLLITGWIGTPMVGGRQVIVERFLINGKSWPHTERLTYDVGDTVRIRVLNVGAAVRSNAPARLLFQDRQSWGRAGRQCVSAEILSTFRKYRAACEWPDIFVDVASDSIRELVVPLS